MDVIQAPAGAPGGGGGGEGGRWVTKVIRQPILAPASIGANDIKAALTKQILTNDDYETSDLQKLQSRCHFNQPKFNPVKTSLITIALLIDSDTPLT